MAVATPKTSIPVELMEILHKMSNDIGDVKDDVIDVRERVIRLEAHNHAETLKTIWSELEKERDKRIKLQIDIESVKTKMAPVTVGISLIGAAIINVIFRTLFAH